MGSTLKDIKKQAEQKERLAVSWKAQAEATPQAPAELQDMPVEDESDSVQPLVEAPLEQTCLQPVQVR